MATDETRLTAGRAESVTSENLRELERSTVNSKVRVFTAYVDSTVNLGHETTTYQIPRPNRVNSERFTYSLTHLSMMPQGTIPSVDQEIDYIPHPIPNSPFAIVINFSSQSLDGDLVTGGVHITPDGKVASISTSQQDKLVTFDRQPDNSFTARGGESFIYTSTVAGIPADEVPYMHIPGIDADLQKTLLTRRLKISATAQKLRNNFTDAEPSHLADCLVFGQPLLPQRRGTSRKRG